MQLVDRIDLLRRLGRILAGHPVDQHTDWVSLVELARRQGVAPFLFWRLSQGASDAPPEQSVPPEVVMDLREDLYTAVANGIRAEAQLARVLGALSRADIPAIVVKGAALGAFYPDTVLRLYGDIDIMIARAQLDRAEQTLYAQGYRCITSKDWWRDRIPHLSPVANESGELLVELQWLDHIHHLPPMASESGMLLVELHWQLDYDEMKGRLPAEDLWARVVPWMVRGQPALRLDPIDEALYLCRHAVVQHKVRGAFRSLFDLNHVTASWGLAEWRALCTRAQHYGLERPIYLMLVLAEELLDLGVPEEVLSELKPSRLVAEPDQLLQRLLGASDDPEASISPGVMDVLVRGALGARLRVLVSHIFLPRSGMAEVYHLSEESPRIWFAYLWRPLDLLWRYGRMVWRVLRGERGARAAWQREVWLERWLRGEALQRGADGDWSEKP